MAFTIKDPKFHPRGSSDESIKDYTLELDPYMVVDIVKLQQGIDKAMILKSKKKSNSNMSISITK